MKMMQKCLFSIFQKERSLKRRFQKRFSKTKKRNACFFEFCENKIESKCLFFEFFKNENDAKCLFLIFAKGKQLKNKVPDAFFAKGKQLVLNFSKRKQLKRKLLDAFSNKKTCVLLYFSKNASKIFFLSCFLFEKFKTNILN